jgi:hypothetical protein
MSTSNKCKFGALFVAVTIAWLACPVSVTAQLVNFGGMSRYDWPSQDSTPQGSTPQSPTTQSSATQSSATQGPTPTKPAEAAPAVQKPGDHAVVSRKNSSPGPHTPSLASAPQIAAQSPHTAAPSPHR